jgi:hypothetical protein
MHFEFVVHIIEDPLGRKKLLDKFDEFLAGREPASVNLREDICKARCNSMPASRIFPAPIE